MQSRVCNLTVERFLPPADDVATCMQAESPSGGHVNLRLTGFEHDRFADLWADLGCSIGQLAMLIARAHRTKFGY